MMKKIFNFALALLFMLAFTTGARAATLYDDGEIVIDSTNLYPKTDAGSTLGKSGNEFAGLYVDSITLGGEAKTSWGSVISPMTDADGYVYPTDSGGLTKLYDAGYIGLGGNTAVDCYVLLDSDDDDFYIGRDDTDNDLHIGAGSTVGTNSRIQIDDDTDNTIITIGDNTNAYDHYVIFDGNAVDYHLGYLDTYDMLIAAYGSTPDSDMCFGVENAATPKLVLWNGIDGYGAIDLDYGSADITDHTFISDGGTLIIDGTITLTDAEVISNPTDDTVRIASNDADTILEIYTPFDTTGDVYLQFAADLGDEAGETWKIGVDGATTDLLIRNDDASQGTQVTVFTISDPGIVTTTNAVNVVYNSALTTTVSDMLNIKHTTSDTAAAGIGAGLTFSVEDASGNLDENASIDAVYTTATHGGTQAADIVFKQMTAGTVAETLRIVGVSTATTSDYLQFTGNTTETNGLHNILVLKTATGTAADNYGISISFQPEDATGSEEVARIDIVETTAARATNDTDFVFTQNINGALTETLRLDADVGLTVTGNALLIGTTPLLTIGDSGDEDTGIVIDGQGTDDYYIAFDTTDDDLKIGYGTAIGTTPRITLVDTAVQVTLGSASEADNSIVFDGNAQDFYIGLKDSVDDLVIGVGSALGTTQAIGIDENQIVTFAQPVVFGGGQTKKVLIPVEDVELDGASAPTLGQNGTNGRCVIPSLEFDADGGSTGDDLVFIHWVVPPGYVTDSARLNVYWSYDTAETDGDDVVFDMAVNAVAVGEVIDGAGTAFTEGDTDIPNADTTVGYLFKTTLNPEVEDIVIGDLVTIMFWVDESASDLDASGTCDVHYFEIEYESTE